MINTVKSKINTRPPVKSVLTIEQSKSLLDKYNEKNPYCKILVVNGSDCPPHYAYYTEFYDSRSDVIQFAKKSGYLTNSGIPESELPSIDPSTLIVGSNYPDYAIAALYQIFLLEASKAGGGKKLAKQILVTLASGTAGGYAGYQIGKRLGNNQATGMGVGIVTAGLIGGILTARKHFLKEDIAARGKLMDLLQDSGFSEQVSDKDLTSATGKVIEDARKFTYPLERFMMEGGIHKKAEPKKVIVVHEGLNQFKL